MLYCFLILENIINFTCFVQRFIFIFQAHFEPKMWSWLGPTKRRLRPDAVPTIFDNQRLPNKECPINSGYQTGRTSV